MKTLEKLSEIAAKNVGETATYRESAEHRIAKAPETEAAQKLDSISKLRVEESTDRAARVSTADKKIDCAIPDFEDCLTDVETIREAAKYFETLASDAEQMALDLRAMLPPQI